LRGAVAALFASLRAGFRTRAALQLEVLALRHQLAVHQRRGADFATTGLVSLRKLRQSRLDNSRDALMAELIAVHLLVVDDFPLEPMTREENRDVYQLFVERTGRASSVVTSNRDTAEWLATFDGTLLAQSAIDRFQNAAYDLVIEGESYRSRLKPTIDKAGPPPERPVEKKPVHPRQKRQRWGPRRERRGVRSRDRSLASHPGPMSLASDNPLWAAAEVCRRRPGRKPGPCCSPRRCSGTQRS
jgi:hypothetical protein